VLPANPPARHGGWRSCEGGRREHGEKSRGATGGAVWVAASEEEVTGGVEERTVRTVLSVSIEGHMPQSPCVRCGRD
jgi:hypothetical protein